jgi:hypothetical protein
MATKRQTQAEVVKACRGMTAKNYAWLCRYDALLENMYAVWPDQHVAVVPDRSAGIPWFVALLLGSTSRKHIYINNRGLQLAPVRKAIANLVNKIKWCWHFRHSERDAPWQKPLVRREVRRYKAIVPPEVAVFTRRIAATAERQVRIANKRIARRKCYGNTPAFVMMALKWLRHNGMQALQSDKDGVFVILHRSTADKLAAAKISNAGASYKMVADFQPEIDYEQARNTMKGICKTLRALGRDDYARACHEVFDQRGHRGLVSKVNLTVKTHKPVVECRIIHSSPASSFEAISRIVHNVLTTKCNELVHLCRDTKDFISKLTVKTFPQDCHIEKWDVKEFYMAAEHKAMIEAIIPVINVELRSVIESILWTVLFHQFVSWNGNVYRVETGSGMGQLHSGSLADLSFWRLVENPLFLAEHGILCWMRFRDDIFTVFKTKEEASSCLQALQRQACPHWKISRDESSSFGVAMLDCFVYKGPRFRISGKFDHAPHIKKSARHVPLDSSSAHPPSVHKSWPISEVRRMAALSMHRFSFEYYRRAKCLRFSRFFMD